MSVERKYFIAFASALGIISIVPPLRYDSVATDRIVVRATGLSQGRHATSVETHQHHLGEAVLATGVLRSEEAAQNAYAPRISQAAVVAQTQFDSKNADSKRVAVDASEAFANIMPLLKECFELGKAERPDLHEAHAIADLELVAGEQNQAVVITANVGEGSDSLPTAAAECVQETLYRLEMAVPDGQKTTRIVYPLDFVTKGEEGRRINR